jgi:hypothetical protein
MHPDPSGAMHATAGWRVAVCLALAAALTACGAPPESRREAPASAPASVAPPPPVAAATPSTPLDVATPPASARVEAPGHPVEMVLAYADLLRRLPPAELPQEIDRLAVGDESPVRVMQLAMALAQSRVAANTVRAQALLQRVLGQDEAQARSLHPMARLLLAQLAETRRAEEQIERQAQQLRDAQRRITQLNERLEAVRTIERSLPPPPAAGASAPAGARP